MNYITKDKNTFFKLSRLDTYMTGHKGYIAGGCFKNLFTDTKVKDVDIFFLTQEDFLEAEKYYKKNVSQWSYVYENKNAIGFKHKHFKTMIEIVRSRFGTPEEMLSVFDFTIVKFAYYKDTSNDGIEYKALYHPYFFEDLLNKKLVIDGKIEDIPFPVGTFNRTYKYQKYGYGMCRETKTKVIQLLQNQNSEDIDANLYFGFD